MTTTHRLALLICLCATTALSARQQPARTDGRYGLWIEDRRDTMVVHWLTPDSTAGYLRAASERGDEEFNTGSGFTHAVRFRRPGGKSVRLQFGGHTLEHFWMHGLVPSFTRQVPPRWIVGNVESHAVLIAGAVSAIGMPDATMPQKDRPAPAGYRPQQ